MLSSTSMHYDESMVYFQQRGDVGAVGHFTIIHISYFKLHASANGNIQNLHLRPLLLLKISFRMNHGRADAYMMLLSCCSSFSTHT